MAPKELPGFYFDEARNRYFPIASKPKSAVPIIETSGNKRKREEEENKRRVELLNAGTGCSFWKTSDQLKRESYQSFNSNHVLHELQSKQYAHAPRIWSEDVSSSPLENLSALSVCARNPNYQVAGGDHGWTYIRIPLPNDIDGEGSTEGGRWLPELGLLSTITATSISGDKYLAASLGPHPKAAIGSFNLDSMADESSLYEPTPMSTCVLEPKGGQDIRCASLLDQSIAFGMRGHVWWTPDYDVPGGRARFPVDGDVISLSHSEKEINAGLRNGSVRSFDLRVPPDKGRQLVVARSAVTSLFKIRDWELLVGAMNGNLDMYDVRFLPSWKDAVVPTLSFEGHVNSFTSNLAMTLDPFADFLLAAGQDCRIRGWSTRTGRHILVPQTEVDNPSQDLWTTVFNKPILGMDVSEERGRTFVWVANETKVDKFELGKMV